MLAHIYSKDPSNSSHSMIHYEFFSGIKSLNVAILRHQKSVGFNAKHIFH